MRGYRVYWFGTTTPLEGTLSDSKDLIREGGILESKLRVRWSDVVDNRGGITSVSVWGPIRGSEVLPTLGEVMEKT